MPASFSLGARFFHYAGGLVSKNLAQINFRAFLKTNPQKKPDPENNAGGSSWSRIIFGRPLESGVESVKGLICTF